MTGHFLSAGDPEQLTGGHIYNRRILSALAAQGWPLQHHVLPGDYPEPAAGDHAAACDRLAALPDDSVVVIDGLALGALAEAIVAHSTWLRLVALVHLPLGAEVGTAATQLRERAAREARALAACRRIIANSEHTRDGLVRRGLAPTAIDVVPPGTEPAPLARGADDTTRLICVATVTPRKGQDLLVDALAGLVGLSWHCRLVGSVDRDPAFAARVRERIDQAGLADRISLVGECAGAALEACWHEADLAVLPSHYEGYGMVITEAIARGLPVVATAGGAVGEALPPATGLLSAPGDRAALEVNLGEFLGNAELRGTLAEMARRARRGLPTWDERARQFAHALERTG